MEAHPWLPSFASAASLNYLEGSPDGSSFVQISREPFAPLHYLDNAMASPFVNPLKCTAGYKTVDGVCTGQLPSGPYWTASTLLNLLTREPFETLPVMK